MKFSKMTDAELLDFCEDNFCELAVCKALGCEENCIDEDCPLAQLFQRFKKKITEETPRTGKWYKETIPTPPNAKNTTMEHYRLVCPFCGMRAGKKKTKFCADCGAILR